MTTCVSEITEMMPAETIIFTVNTAKGKKQQRNETEKILYKDKLLTIVEKIVERNDNPYATYIIKEFSDKAAFSKLLSKTEIICELEKLFQDLDSTSDINITNAIESFRKKGDSAITFPITSILPLYSTLAQETVTLSDKDPQNIFLQTTSHILMVVTETVTKHFTHFTELSIPETMKTANDKSKLNDGLMILIISPLTVNLSSSTTESSPVISV